jgi:hypothetical protein
MLRILEECMRFSAKYAIAAGLKEEAGGSPPADGDNGRFARPRVRDGCAEIDREASLGTL